MKRVLIGTNSLVDEFTKKLKVLRKIDDGWSIIYKDGDTKEEWLEYVVDPERGYYRNLMLITPKPTTSELIKIAFESNNDDEIYAAAKRLEIESPKKESKFRLEILKRIKQYDLENISDRDKERIMTIIGALELTSEMNRNEIVGKHISEIEKDYENVKMIAIEAKRILNSISR